MYLRFVILRCGICGEEHWHHPIKSEVICHYCESWSETYNHALAMYRHVKALQSLPERLRRFL